MLVKDRMSHPVLTVRIDMPIQEALKRMHEEHVRRFPVIDKASQLVGIVSEKDLLHASPSDATSLNVWEITYLLSKITVSQVMTRDVVTVEEHTPIEEAARIMADSRIGGLPVLRENKLVGIITETDLFKIFLEALGGRDSGVRLSLLLHDRPGQLSDLTRVISENGGNVLALATFLGASSDNRQILLKVSDIECRKLMIALDPIVDCVLDVREC